MVSPTGSFPMLTESDLRRKSVQYRKELLQLIKNCGSGHTGGDLSCLDILNVLYNRILRVSPETFKSPDRDYYIQSKGHCAEALFVVLADQGFFPNGSTEDVCQLAPLDEKFAAFGFAVERCDGNDIGELLRTLERVPFRPGKPSLVLARTRKGKGVSFMENVAKWHHGVPTDAEFGRAMAELEAAEAALA
jgi:transketolase N-terminal domain/subunit